MLGPLVSSRRIAEARKPNPRKPRHGKEGVDGSSPSEGFRKSPANAGLFTSGFIALPLGRSGMKQILEQQGEKAPDFVVWTDNETRQPQYHRTEPIEL